VFTCTTNFVVYIYKRETKSEEPCWKNRYLVVLKENSEGDYVNHDYFLVSDIYLYLFVYFLKSILTHESKINKY
jgi:hypothetical protein